MDQCQTLDDLHSVSSELRLRYAHAESGITDARASFRAVPGTVDDVTTVYPTQARELLMAFARNCKRGPFLSTAGINIPYYMNLSTNFLDRSVAPSAVFMLESAIQFWFAKRFEGKTVVCIGPEVAGGILVAQLAASLNKTLDWVHFVYMRKEPKKSGTHQQLEGPLEFSERGPHSEPIDAIWVDDCLSTGSSLAKGQELLREKFNIHVRAATFFVDRSCDRLNLTAEQQHLTPEFLKTVDVRCIFDLAEIDMYYKRLYEKK